MTNKTESFEISSWRIYETDKDWMDVLYVVTTQNPYLQSGENEPARIFRVERIDLDKIVDGVCFGVGVHSKCFVVHKK